MGEDGSRTSVRFALHEVADGAQAEHGLRAGPGDEEACTRYRQYCARRVRRARKALKLVCGKGKQFTRRDVTAEVEGGLTVRHLGLVLTLAERNWAHALELRHAANGPRKKGGYLGGDDDDAAAAAADGGSSAEESAEERRGAVARRARKRMQVAALFAADLETLCEKAGADPLTAVEARAYALWLRGLALELEGQAAPAAEKVREARDLYAELAKNVASPRLQDIFAKRRTDADAAARRCEYAAQLTGAVLPSSSSAASIAESMKGLAFEGGESSPNKEARTTVTFGRVTVDSPVSAKLEARLRALRLLDGDEAVTDADVASETAYAKRVGALADLGRAVADECARTCPPGQGGEKVDAQRRAYDVVRAKAAFARLDHMASKLYAAVDTAAAAWKRASLAALGRAFASSSALEAEAPDDVVHVYDQLLQVVDEMQACVVQGADDDALTEELECRAAMLKALKCFYLAEVYAAEASRAVAQGGGGADDGQGAKNKAATLRRHCVALAERATLEAEACGDDATARAMARLADDARAARVRAAAARALARASSKAKSSKQPADDATATPAPLISRLAAHESFGADASPPFGIAPIPPRPTPVATKPLLFDIAFSHLDFVSLDAKAGIAKEATDQRRGLFGWFRR